MKEIIPLGIRKKANRLSSNRQTINGYGLKTLYIALFFSVLNLFSLASQENLANGESLFKQHCASCHKLDKKLTGPPLRGIDQKRSKEWLHLWIKDNAGLRASGDSDAIAIFEEYNGTAMNAFPQLSEQDIDDVIAYSAQPKPQATGGAGVAAGGQGNQEAKNPFGIFEICVIFIFFLTLAYILFKSKNALKIAKGEKKATLSEDVNVTWTSFIKNQFLVLSSVIVLALVGFYFIFAFFMDIGIDQGYQPIQPIDFSHKIHAGDNKIDCKYCHSSARLSKTSGVPSADLCMNCHKFISEYNGPEFAKKEYYDKEIQKIYDAVGWDAENQAYTGETKPIKWVKIHNLPDFVYFNHSQHVSVAGLECQKCHGPVEEMDEVYQFSELTMGWCVDCHRTSQVQMANNPYYDKIHKELATKYGVEKLTVAQLGGLECGKCHY